MKNSFFFRDGIFTIPLLLKGGSGNGLALIKAKVNSNRVTPAPRIKDKSSSKPPIETTTRSTTESTPKTTFKSTTSKPTLKPKFKPRT